MLNSTTNTSRRVFMRTSAGVAGVGGITGLAGCILDEGTDEDPEDFPSGDITVVIPAAEGGPTDAVFRGIQSPLADELGVSLVSDYRTGAGGGIGLEHVWNEPTDGYTLCVNASANTALNAAAGDADIEPTNLSLMSTLARSYNGWFAPADEWDDWDDFVQTAIDEGIEVGTVGATGSTTHFEMLLGADSADIPLDNITAVPYDGGSEVAQAVASGDIPMGITTPNTMIGFVDEGNAEPILMNRPDESSIFPDAAIGADKSPEVPYIGLDGTLFGPPDVHEEIISTVSEAAQNAVETDEFATFAEDNGYDIIGHDVDETLDLFEEMTEQAETYMDLAN